jgi:hypothetical protein
MMAAVDKVDSGRTERISIPRAGSCSAFSATADRARYRKDFRINNLDLMTRLVDQIGPEHRRSADPDMKRQWTIAPSRPTLQKVMLRPHGPMAR